LHEGPTISGAYLSIDSMLQPALYRTLKQMPRIAGVAVREQEIINYNKTMRETMLFYSYVGSVFSVIIAFGIIYNNARISLTERGRELASLRVLGLTRAEISYILLGELGILTLLALPLGVVTGEWLCKMIVINAQTDLFRVPVVLELDTYAFSITIVLISALASGLLVRRRLDELDLIAVLKTRE
jgi:putative ABC transport system permease protein